MQIANRFIFGFVAVALLAFPAMAQQISCDAFKRNAAGDWVAKQDMKMPGPTGPIDVKAGEELVDIMQDRLDRQCKKGSPE